MARAAQRSRGHAVRPRCTLRKNRDPRSCAPRGPVQGPKFVLAITLNTAKMLDIDVPPQLLARADEVSLSRLAQVQVARAAGAGQATEQLQVADDILGRRVRIVLPCAKPMPMVSANRCQRAW